MSSPLPQGEGMGVRVGPTSPFRPPILQAPTLPAGCHAFACESMRCPRPQNCCKSTFHNPKTGVSGAEFADFWGLGPAKTALALAPGPVAFRNVKIGKTKRVVFRSFFDALRSNYDTFRRFLYAFCGFLRAQDGYASITLTSPADSPCPK
jgi:hypothetical protein